MTATLPAVAKLNHDAVVPDGLPTPQRGRAMAVIILGIAVAVLDGTIMNLALPSIARELGASASHAIWVVNAYQIAILVMLLPLASLGDLFGYRRIYLLGMGLFTLSSLAAVLSNSMGTLIAARTLQGLGAAGIMSVNAALVRLIYPSSRLGRGMAVIANILDPDCFVMGGGMSNVTEIYDRLPDVIDRHTFSDGWQGKIVPAKWGDSSGVRGAAHLWPAQ